MPSPSDYDAIVIGSGMGGLASHAGFGLPGFDRPDISLVARAQQI